MSSRYHFHVSREQAELSIFHPLSHFGTLEAALDRAESGSLRGVPDPLLYRVQLDYGNPLTTRDLFETNHSWLKLADYLFYNKKVLSSDERGRILDAAAPSGTNTQGGNEALCAILGSKGYDAITYRNEHEDRGSISVIILRPEAVHIVDVARLSEIDERRWPFTAPVPAHRPTMG